MAPLDQHSSNNTCYPDPNFQKPGFYRCSIQTGRVSLNYDVEHCAVECTAWDQDTNNFYAKKNTSITPPDPTDHNERVK